MFPGQSNEGAVYSLVKQPGFDPSRILRGPGSEWELA